MARPRNYKIEEVLTKIREYRVAHPTEILKPKSVSNYLKENGFAIEPYTIKRTPELMDELEKLNRGSAAEMIATIAIYKKLDIDRLFQENRTPEALRQAIRTLDDYYGALAASASAALTEKDKLSSEVKTLQKSNNELKSQIEDTKHLKDENRRLRKEISALKNTLNKYVYPDVAKSLLSEAGFSDTDGVADPEKVNEMTVNESTEFNVDILNAISLEIT